MCRCIQASALLRKHLYACMHPGILCVCVCHYVRVCLSLMSFKVTHASLTRHKQNANLKIELKLPIFISCLQTQTTQ